MEMQTQTVRTGRRGRPRRRPDKQHPTPDRPLESPGAGSRTASGWANTRCAVEYTLAWLARFRRLAIRYERRADLHDSRVCLHLSPKQAKRFCP